MSWAPRTMNKYMIATTAIHKLGDISRPVNNGDYSDNLCTVYHEDSDNWIGMWVTGFGFGDVKFPKSTTRELTNEETEYFNGRKIQINNQPPFSLQVKP